ncbi:MAG TPA: hypothetical protein PK002_11280 [Cellvibrio sp.]|nr:hypothetical protein [Cellvibrio sp.]
MVYLAFFLAFIAHVFFGALLTKEVLFWPRLSTIKRSFLLFSIWFIPVLGAVISYKAVKLDWFRKGSSRSSASGSALLDFDSVFNPGARHVIEARQEVRIEQRKSGEPYGEETKA